MKNTILKITEIIVDMGNYKDGAAEAIADIIENYNPDISKEETAAIKKVAKALALNKLDKLKSDAEFQATALEAVE